MLREDVQGAKGTGRPLPVDLRTRAAPHLGSGVHDVELHTGERADRLARMFRARALTVGSDVFFRSGALDAASPPGRRLLTHELVHASTPAPDSALTTAGPSLAVQRVFLGTSGEAYRDVSRAPWFKALSPGQQLIAQRMHGDTSVQHHPHQAANAVLAEEQRLQSLTTTTTTTTTAPAFGAPSSPALLPPTGAGPYGSSSNPFVSRLGFGSGAFQPSLVEPDDPVDEPSLSTIETHYRDKMVEGLKSARQRWVDEDDSSDSEDEVGTDPKRRERRRQYKAGQLTALTRTMFPLDDDEARFREELRQKRERDDVARSGKRQMYAPDTRELLSQVGEQLKQTNMEHNPFLRRAARRAIKKDKVRVGGSKNYDQQQSRVRDSLLEVLQEDHKSMGYQRSDFHDDRTWDAVQFMLREPMSNAPKDLYSERVASGADTTGASARMAFHHLAWKEAQSGAFSGFALTPANLSAVNDSRELLNPKKRKALEDAGEPLPPVGAHDAFGHQGTGFLATEKGRKGRARGGGQFKDIDLEADWEVMKPSLQPRTPKARLYDVPPAPALSTISTVSTPVADEAESDSDDEMVPPAKRAKKNIPTPSAPQHRHKRRTGRL